MEPGPYFRKRLYYQVPHMVTCNYVELVGDLMAVKLDDMPDWAEALAIELRRRADEAQAQLASLGSQHDLRREHAEVEVEREVDELVWALHSSFEHSDIELMRISYPDRFRALTSMLRTLREDPLQLELLHTPVRLMVQRIDDEQRFAERLREHDEARGLGGARVALRWGLAVYASRIGDLADRWSEDSCARVNASLQPFVDWVERMKQQH